VPISVEQNFEHIPDNPRLPWVRALCINHVAAVCRSVWARPAVEPRERTALLNAVLTMTGCHELDERAIAEAH